MKNNVFFLSRQDQQFVENHGVTMDEVKRQWSLLTDEPKRIVLDRPCTTEDGIKQLPENDWSALTATHRAAADKGRWKKFVPASGAASRMFALKSPNDQKRFFDSFTYYVLKRRSINTCDRSSRATPGRSAQRLTSSSSRSQMPHRSRAKNQ